MRYIVMHKVDADMEAGAPPSQDIIRGMGKLVGDSLKSGVFLDGAGLHRSAQRVRVRCAGGECTVTEGPFTGENELVASFAMIKAKSMDDAIEHTRRFAAVAGDADIEIGPVVEPWDLKLAPKPPHIEGGRFLLLFKGDAAYEAGAQPTPERRAAHARLTDELTKAGVLLEHETLAATSKGARLASAAKGKRTWTDGPFTESKELIAGFSILGVNSKDEAITWANDYAAILGNNEVDIRLLLDP